MRIHFLRLDRFQIALVNAYFWKTYVWFKARLRFFRLGRIGDGANSQPWYYPMHSFHKKCHTNLVRQKIPPQALARCASCHI